MHPESHVPRYGRELAPAIIRSGCRGVNGLVPQPLCMKFKSAREQTVPRRLQPTDRSVKRWQPV